MAIDIPLFDGLSLKMDAAGSAGNDYPTTVLQKGLLLIDSGMDLTEEAVGFGLPVIKKGFQTIFPGSVAIEHRQREKFDDIFAIYKLNLTENISTDKNKNSLRGVPLFHEECPGSSNSSFAAVSQTLNFGLQ